MLIAILISGLAFGQEPIEEVVTLIENLRGKIVADGEDEEAVYNKLATWCTDTKANKTSSIDTATEEVDMLTQQITEYSGEKGTYEAHIKQLKKDIADNEATRKQASDMRKKQNVLYSKERKDAEQCIGALESATRVLSGVGSTLQKSQTLSLAKDINVAILKLPSSSIVTDDEKRLLGAFLNNEAGSFLQSSNHASGEYTPQSTRVQGILKTMYNTYVAELERANSEEAKQSKQFKELMSSKNETKETLTALLTQKQKKAAENVQNLADAKLKRANLRAELRTDRAFLQEVKENCLKEANAWADRTRLRTEELASIDEALKILSPHPSATSFLQKPRRSKKEAKKKSVPKSSSKAYKLLTRLAQKHNSIRLASLAVSVQSTGHFTNVIRMIDNMMATIRAEDKDDIDAKRRCSVEYAALESELGDLHRNLDKQAKILTLLSMKAGELDAQVEETDAQITIIKDEMAILKEDRVEEQKEFQKTLADDREALKAIRKAVVILTNFYRANNMPVGFVEKKGTKAKQRKEPEYNDENVAPEGFAGKSYGDRNTERGSIIVLLENLQATTENKIKRSIAEDSENQVEYGKIQGLSRTNLKALQKKRADLQTAKADNSKKSSTALSEETNLLNLDAANFGAFQAHCTECQWVYSTSSTEHKLLKTECKAPNFTVSETSSFDARKRQRADELSGLQDAKAALAGVEED